MQAVEIRRASSRTMFASCLMQTAGICLVRWRIVRGKQSKRRCGVRRATKANRRGCLGLHRVAFTIRCGNTELRMASLECDERQPTSSADSAISLRDASPDLSLANVKECSGNL